MSAIQSSWGSYPKIFNLGHRVINDLLLDAVTIEEKVDGSQFSFGVFDGELKLRSKNKEFSEHNPEKLFTKAVNSVLEIKDKLTPGWTYRAEYLKEPKHNTLAYNRIPYKNLMVFDICIAQETYLSYEAKKKWAEDVGLEVVPLIKKGMVNSIDELHDMLNRESVLGGQKIEGIVIKNYSRYNTIDSKVLMGKHVSEHFKEIHGGEWRKNNPSKGDVIDSIINALTTPARWDKAVQHMRDDGVLDNSPKDIGTLIKYVQNDITEECGDEIKERILKWALPQILRGTIKGLPEWYKNKLMDSQPIGAE